MRACLRHISVFDHEQDHTQYIHNFANGMVKSHAKQCEVKQNGGPQANDARWKIHMHMHTSLLHIEKYCLPRSRANCHRNPCAIPSIKNTRTMGCRSETEHAPFLLARRTVPAFSGEKAWLTLSQLKDSRCTLPS